MIMRRTKGKPLQEGQHSSRRGQAQLAGEAAMSAALSHQAHGLPGSLHTTENT